MKDRSRSILEKSIDSFIKTGRPVTSELLYDEYDFGIKPAMIRWELNDLSEAGYFYQTHPSGGRMPTNKAYRFLVSEILKGVERSFEDYVAETVLEFIEGERDRLTQKISKSLGILGVSYEPKHEWFNMAGLKDLCESLDLKNKKEFVEVISDLEVLPERLGKSTTYFQGIKSWPQVFVGGSPITKSKELSVIANRFKMGDTNVFVLAIGPRRMDYERSVRLFRSFDLI